MARKRQRQRSTKPILLLVALIVIAASISVYVLYGTHSASSTDARSTGVNNGNKAPEMPVALTNGTSTALSKFQGHTVLLWIVATWCPGCQQTAPIIASQYYSQLHSNGVILLTVEDYNDLGYSGPTVAQFANQYAGGVGSHPGWLFAETSQSATYTFNPQADLDIYYLIGPSGIIVASGANLEPALQSLIAMAGNLQVTAP